MTRYYASIRQFRGTAGSADPRAETYRSLGQLYVHDERYAMVDGEPNPAFAAFMSRAMAYFADARLKG